MKRLTKKQKEFFKKSNLPAKTRRYYVKYFKEIFN